MALCVPLTLKPVFIMSTSFARILLAALLVGGHLVVLCDGLGPAASAQPHPRGQCEQCWQRHPALGRLQPRGQREFVQNEIKVFDLDQNALGTQWHIISSEIIAGNLVLPTGWVMPSFLYDANQLAHCYIGVQVTVENGLQSVSDPSPFLCSIHLSIEEGATPGTVDLEWNSPYALSGDAAGGDFQIERLSELTAEWEPVATQPDSPLGGSFTDNPGPCAQVLIYRIRQLATNLMDWNESNRADLVIGTAGEETPTVTHVDVENGLAHVYWDFEPEPETLGYIVYKCLDTGGGAIVAASTTPAPSARWCWHRTRGGARKLPGGSVRLRRRRRHAQPSGRWRLRAHRVLTADQILHRPRPARVDPPRGHARGRGGIHPAVP